jgi:hypothetical protein
MLGRGRFPIQVSVTPHQTGLPGFLVSSFPALPGFSGWLSALRIPCRFLPALRIPSPCSSHYLLPTTLDADYPTFSGNRHWTLRHHDRFSRPKPITISGTLY